MLKSSAKKINSSSGIFVVLQECFNSSASQNLSCRPKSTLRSLLLITFAATLTLSSARRVLMTSEMSSEEENTIKG